MTDFGKILDEWDGIRTDKITKEKGSSFSDQLENYLPDPNSEKGNFEGQEQESSYSTSHPRYLPVDRVIDLHGMTREAAGTLIHRAIEDASSSGMRKLLFVHGKGNHSRTEPVLKKLLYTIIEKHPQAGMAGQASKKDGGSGASWLIIRDAQKKPG